MLLALLVIWSDYASYNASSADSATKCQSMRWEIMTSLCSHSEYGSITGQTRWKHNTQRKLTLNFKTSIANLEIKFAKSVHNAIFSSKYKSVQFEQLRERSKQTVSAKHASGNGGIQHTLSSGRSASFTRARQGHIWRLYARAAPVFPTWVIMLVIMLALSAGA